VTLPEAGLVTTTLGELGEESRAYRSPAIAVIGSIVAERERLKALLAGGPVADAGPALP
jgi:siroheme synthase